MSNVRIDIAAVWKGAQAFNKATKATKKLDAQVATLGKTLVSVYAANKALQFSKKMVNAFAEDQASAAILSNTVKNLGLAFADVDIKDFIDKLSLASGVADDELRPAMQRLLTTTGSLAKSQDLLKNAIDISKGSGQSLETVALDLANAYVGNNKGLKKYTLGLSAAELKTASFDTVLQAFNKNFSGANAAYLSTYAGQLEKITVAGKEAQETIGSGLIDAFKILAGDNTIGSLSEKITKLANNTADFFRGLAQGFKDLANMPVIKQLLQLAGIMLKLAGKAAGAVIDPFVKEGARSRSAALAPASSNSFLNEHMAASNASKQKAAEAAAAKRAKALLDAQKKNTAEVKKQALAKKQSILFDMDYIQLVAALKGKLSDEERKRVELQLALLTGNEKEAARLSQEIANAIDSTGNLAKYLQTLPDAKNPFKSWDAYLDTLEERLKKLPTLPPGGGGGGGTQPPATNVPPTNANGNAYNPDMPGSAGDDSQFGSGTPWAQAAAGVTVVVNNAGSVISQSELNDSILLALQNASLSGVDTSIARNLANFR